MEAVGEMKWLPFGGGVSIQASAPTLGSSNVSGDSSTRSRLKNSCSLTRGQDGPLRGGTSTEGDKSGGPDWELLLLARVKALEEKLKGLNARMKSLNEEREELAEKYRLAKEKMKEIWAAASARQKAKEKSGSSSPIKISHLLSDKLLKHETMKELKRQEQLLKKTVTYSGDLSDCIFKKLTRVPNTNYNQV